MEIDDDKKEQYFTIFEPPNPIFNEERKLSKSYVPDVLIGRDAQVKDIGANLAFIIRRSNPINMYIWGRTGVGKTITIHNVKDLLQYGITINGYDILVDFIKINSISINTEVVAYNEIITQLTCEIPKQGLSPADYLNIIWKAIAKKASTCAFYSLILFFDEIDEWCDPNSILYNFARAMEERKVTAKNYTIGLILASNKKDYLKTLEARVTDAAGFSYMNFPDYNEHDLIQILNDRIDAFQPNVISDEIISMVAKDVAERYHGNARRALDLLYIAGKLALRQGCSHITREHISQADTELSLTATKEMISNLSKHDKYLLIAIHLCDEIIRNADSPVLSTTGLVLQVYRKICEILGEKNNGDGNTSRRITELDDDQLIHANKRKGYGNTRIITLSPDIEYVIDIIYTVQMKLQLEKQRYDLEDIILSSSNSRKRKAKSLSEF